MSAIPSSLPPVSHPQKNPLAEALRFLRRSKSLRSMLPPLMATGVATLVMTALIRLQSVGTGHEFFARWMETWLTAWPIAFPIVYLIGLATAAKPAGLAVSDIEAASAAATAKNRLKVRRRMPRTFEVA